MEVMYHQHASKHDQLSKEYDELMKPKNPGNSVLGQLEKVIEDKFDAKRVLSHLLIVS